MTDDELNKLLADVAGVKVAWVEETANWHAHWQVEHQGELCEEWNPLEDHNQIAQVKAGLREQRLDYDITWDSRAHHCWISAVDDQRGLDYYHATHRDELRAFAEAIAKMKGAE